MIFYFSATGNSEYVAKKLGDDIAIAGLQPTGGAGDIAITGLQPNGAVISIGAALRDGKFSFALADGERLGFVFPVFAGTLPGAVARFIERLELGGAPGYTFGVITCGGAMGGAGAALDSALNANRSNRLPLHLNAAFELVMPDNFILWSELPDDGGLAAILNAADSALDKITASVLRNETTPVGAAEGMPYLPFQIYGEGAPSGAPAMGEFSVTERCTGCGECEARCPMRCIKLSGGRPEWDGECALCLACLHRCPAAAIEYGDSTRGKRRYYNPRL
jgi:NAD-dependent dihydropyrimidine dehydrogenase PreA subunit